MKFRPGRLSGKGDLVDLCRTHCFVNRVCFFQNDYSDCCRDFPCVLPLWVFGKHLVWALRSRKRLAVRRRQWFPFCEWHSRLALRRRVCWCFLAMFDGVSFLSSSDSVSAASGSKIATWRLATYPGSLGSLSITTVLLSLAPSPASA